MRKSDFFLAGLWLLYVVIIGPALISARDTILVCAGIGILGCLIAVTANRIFKKKEAK